MSLSGIISILAQSTDVVLQFGKCLTNWATYRDGLITIDSLNQLCSQQPAIRIDCDIMTTLAKQNGLIPESSYNLDGFLLCLQHEIDKGITINLSDIQQIEEDLIPQKYKVKSGLEFVSCDFIISGDSHYNEKVLFILLNNRIVKITKNIIIVNDTDE